jgi:hypothetical protein
VLADEPLQTALTDAVTFGQLPLGRARGEGRDELSGVGLAEPIIDPPLAGTHGRGPDTMSRLAELRLRLSNLRHRADQRICEVPVF